MSGTLLFLLFAAISINAETFFMDLDETEEDASAQRRLYNNPYHPEDDNINDSLTEDDGDNLHDLRLGQLSDSEKKEVELKYLKVNGQFLGSKNSPTNNKDERSTRRNIAEK